MPERLIGTVKHYFKDPSVAVVDLSDGDLSVGDEVHVVGFTSNFTEKVTSMEIEHHAVEHVDRGGEVAVAVVARARPHDKVYRLS